MAAVQPRFWRRQSILKKTYRYLAFVIVAVCAAAFMVPVAWMLSSSVSTNAEIFMYPPHWIPERLHFSNYPKAFQVIQYWLYMRNTVVITVAATVGAVLTSSIVGYGFSRLRARGRDVLFVALLATMMLPGQVTLVPVYLIFRMLRWTDTYLPLIVPSWLGGGPFYIFLLRQFYATLPQELDDAAKIDGCGFFGIWWRLLLPLSKPALATVALFSFFSHWNDFLGPLIYLTSPDRYTIAIGLQFYTSFGRVDWSLLMAATVVTVIPPLVAFFFAQRTFVQGIVMTGIKG
ncbi:MAG: carbohydrate ABC transporter permease [Anaerolineae bacterium]